MNFSLTKLSLKNPISPESSEHRQELVEQHMAELCETLVKRSPVGIYVVQNRKFQFTNALFQKYTGFSQDELLDIDPLSIVYPDDRGIVKENAVKMLKQEHSSPYEFRIITKGRQVRWIMETVASIKHRGERAVLGNCIDVTKQMEAKERLEELETLESSVLDACPNAILVLHNHRIIFANDAVEAILGWKSEELMGKTTEVLFQTEDEQNDGHVNSVLEQQADFSSEVHCRHKDGSDIMCLVKSSGISESLKVNKLVATLEDITGRKKADEDLWKQRQELNRRVKELNCLYTISSFVRERDISTGDICKGIVTLIPSAFQCPEMICARLILGKQEFSTGNYQETTCKHTRDITVHGKRIGTLEVCHLAERLESSQESFRVEEIPLVNTIAEQLSEIIRYKQTQETLESTQANLHDIITKNVDGMIVVDSSGILRFVNPAAEVLFGRKAEELLGTPFGYPTVAGEKTEIDIIRKNGKAVTAEMRTGKIEWDNETACLASLSDVTERRQIDETKSEFISLVSSQLKTPVAEIKEHIDRMLAGLTGDLTAEQRHYLEEMQEISSKNLHLISDLLNVSTIERGVISVDIRPVQLKEIVDLAVQSHWEQIKRKGLSLNLEEIDSETIVLADKEKITEALSNVIDNAVKSTDEGSITITIKNGEEVGIVEVVDTGEGMTHDLVHKLFGKKQILNGSLKSWDGPELGLYFAKRLIELQRGDISASSISGKGSRFVLKLPSAKFDIPVAKGQKGK